ncbi:MULTISPECIES: cobyric acid synthase [unclassified Shewanella]|uniref:cobyric acid synthase n=1 Tax=unclassified Shewanella TaxID=196818 RepID=UPI000C8298D8|nr:MULTISPECIES: cobyric acid synthase [unclassified Shewanella]MDO6620531.1 cobyric acid synthase [Shewanella sp. 6_MG-2023]MDO6777208.1 cobyric acid synthase [Shewanella sp. 3_MG-2023]PMG30926.1 cobyric acid synthase CobQ [Shewanella sp. 10N.286.52.C2]PMG51930.1 cobyric acid synthase CobQ [Shewanella sp. 10N.286.52.B9]
MSGFKLMVQGTTSDAGKSLMVAGLCRVLARKGIKVAPFKPQNMALNSAVTPDGGEIGRAQAVQAQACNLPLSVHMNPVLLKPNTDTGAQVIIRGKAIEDMNAVNYHNFKPQLLEIVLESFETLGQGMQARLVEGAGSPAEVNLREQDIANMGFAVAAQTPVVIVADIDRGGVFAHLYGTFDLLSAEEKLLVKGFIINRFRGDITLLESGLTWLTEKTGVPVIGVVPYLHGLYLEAEDAINQQQLDDDSHFKVVVPGLPRISNHTDFDALRLHPGVDLCFVKPGDKLPNADLIILPGSKSVRGDLKALRDRGWDKQIARHLRFGGKLIGICGGYQMLGHSIDDPHGIEGQAGSSEGLGYLNITTTLEKTKTLKQIHGELQLNGNTHPVKGYEIHAGVSNVQETQPFTLGTEDNRYPDGAVCPQNQVLGTYLHGVFDEPQACNALLNWAGYQQQKAQDMSALREENLNRLADSLEESLDLDSLFNGIEGWS